MERVMIKKLLFVYAKTKDADQLRGKHATDPEPLFSLHDAIPLRLKAKISSFYHLFCDATARFVSDLV